MTILNDIKQLFDMFFGFVGVLALLFKFLDRFFDYKFNQKLSELEAKTAKKDRCSSCKDQQR